MGLEFTFRNTHTKKDCNYTAAGTCDSIVFEEALRTAVCLKRFTAVFDACKTMCAYNTVPSGQCCVRFSPHIFRATTQLSRVD